MVPTPSAPDNAALTRLATRMRRWIVEQSLASNVGHIGSAFSIVEIITVLFEAVMRDPGSSRTDRDRFVLGKGHAALALYCALRAKSLMSDEQFATYCRNDSLLGVHPEAFLPGVDVSTGSLGQGLSVGCGLAAGLRERGLDSRVYVLISDAECNEGQTWEAAMFAAHHQLGNVTAIVDLNGLQAMGHTADVLSMSNMAGRWESFGWRAEDIDGHDIAALRRALDPALATDRPRMIVAHTLLGKGVTFMENRLEWHYRNLTPDLAAQALTELGTGV
jgi:transketolase